jgi:hypothetical protein
MGSLPGAVDPIENDQKATWFGRQEHRERLRELGGSLARK